jgi:hypothetical protein
VAVGSGLLGAAVGMAVGIGVAGDGVAVGLAVSCAVGDAVAVGDPGIVGTGDGLGSVPEAVGAGAPELATANTPDATSVPIATVVAFLRADVATTFTVTV